MPFCTWPFLSSSLLHLGLESTYTILIPFWKCLINGIIGYAGLWIRFHLLNRMSLTLIHVFACISNSLFFFFFYVLLSRILLYVCIMVCLFIQPNERHWGLFYCFMIMNKAAISIWVQILYRQKFLSFLRKELTV